MSVKSVSEEIIEQMKASNVSTEDTSPEALFAFLMHKMDAALFSGTTIETSFLLNLSSVYHAISDKQPIKFNRKR